MKEYGKQQQLRNEIICSEDTEDTIDTEDVYSSYNEESDDVSRIIKFIIGKALSKAQTSFWLIINFFF